MQVAQCQDQSFIITFEFMLFNELCLLLLLILPKLFTRLKMEYYIIHLADNFVQQRLISFSYCTNTANSGRSALPPKLQYVYVKVTRQCGLSVLIWA